MFRRFVIVCLLATSATAAAGARAAQSGADRSGLWHIAPPAPRVAEAARLAELAARRAEVMKRVGEKGVLVLFSGAPRVYTGDTDYPFRQENNLYYLTGINQEGATLLLVPGAQKTREILFMPTPVPAAETWTGHMLTAAESRARSGIQEVWPEEMLASTIAVLAPRARPQLSRLGAFATIEDARLQELRTDFQTPVRAISESAGELYLLLPYPYERESREFRHEQTFAADIGSVATGLTIRNAWPILSDMRLRKSEWEIQLLQHGVDITAEAFFRVFGSVAPNQYEYEMHAEFDYAFRRNNAVWGYPCIVGGGANATTLHYETNQDRLAPGSLLLMDCGAEYDHYTVDVTRTIPVDGKFTKEQAEIYRLVYEAQQESIKQIRPGVVLGMSGGSAVNPIHGRAVEVIKAGLLRLGLITSKDNDEYRIWFMHGSNHWIGMNVHDVGAYSTPLAPGMVFTVEPGVYIRPDALDVLPKTPENERFIAAVRPAFEKYKGIGVRIEDDVLVTDGAPRVMSAAIPSRLEDVEATMAKLRAQRKE